jgi:hypothetical protein
LQAVSFHIAERHGLQAAQKDSEARRAKIDERRRALLVR